MNTRQQAHCTRNLDTSRVYIIINVLLRLVCHPPNPALAAPVLRQLG